MATRKTTFEVVKLAEIAPLLKDAEILGNGKAAEHEMAPARILSITYDRSLAATREMLFSSVGFQVFSASTLDQAINLCRRKKFELIVIGHSIPLESRRLLVRELRRRCATPLLALHRPGETPVAGVDHVFDSTQSPARLLADVVGILRPESGTPAGNGDD
jgi:DNA-binding response OmpR family regulator